MEVHGYNNPTEHDIQGARVVLDGVKAKAQGVDDMLNKNHYQSRLLPIQKQV